MREKCAWKHVATVVSGCALAVALSAARADAATILFDFRAPDQGGNPTGGAEGSGTLGNVRTFTVGTVSVTVTGWGYLTNFQDGALGRWNQGLGVCNQQAEGGSGCSDPNHQVDNQGSSGTRDWVLFQFSEAVNLTSMIFETTSGADVDASYYIAADLNPLPSDRLDNDTTGALGGYGFGSITNNPGSGSTRTLLFGGPTAEGLLFGALAAGNDDAFKIRSLTVVTQQAPEPASMLLLGTGLLGVATVARRRRKGSA